MLPLRPGSRRSTAQAHVERGVREGKSAGAIFRALEPAGLSYRRTDFLADVRFFAGRQRLVDPLRSVRLDRLPTEGLMSIARRHQSQRYLYTLEVRVRGVEEPIYRSISTSRRISRGDAIAEATAPSRRYGGWETRRDIEDADLYAIDRLP